MSLRPVSPDATSPEWVSPLTCSRGGSSPWAIATWAPPALLGVEVNKLSGATETGGAYRALSDEPDLELSPVGVGIDRLHPAPGPSKSSTTAELSGIYFGILNIYTALPQFVGAFIAAIVFAVLEPGGGPEPVEGADADNGTPDGTGPSAISACLFIGALSALVAASATRKLKRL